VGNHPQEFASTRFDVNAVEVYQWAASRASPHPPLQQPLRNFAPHVKFDEAVTARKLEEAVTAGDCDGEDSTFWDHTRCKDPARCCWTDWSTEGSDDCCQTCQDNSTCAAWEWWGADPDGPACYLCNKEVLPYRNATALSDNSHITGFASPTKRS
jgi:hypothetical protein